MSSELLGCPFCGSEEILGMPHGAAPGYWMKCSTCGAETSDSSSREIALQRWNTRASSAWFDECAKQAGKAMCLSKQLDAEKTKLAAAIDLARAASICIERLDRMCRGENVTDIEACNAAYRMAIDVFKTVAIP